MPFPATSSLGQVAVGVVGISCYFASCFVGDSGQSGLSIIVIMQGKFGIIPHFYGKSRFIPYTVIGVILDHILVLGQFCRFSCDLSGGVIIDKSGVVLCGYIPIGIVGITMFRLFPCLFFFCDPLCKTVLIIVGVFLGVAVFVYGFGEVAVYIISIGFSSALWVSKSN